MDINIIKGDITKLKVHAIVNAANSSLLGGGGVDGAIHKAGGKEILDACVKIRNRQGGCKVGEAVYTPAGLLNCKYVIHTVGPKWNKGNSNEDQKLISCYNNVLKIAENLKVKSIAFPNISTGIYGYPKDLAAEVAINSIKKFNACNIEFLTFVCFDDENFRIYNELI